MHRKSRPVSIRWALEPLLCKRVTGFCGGLAALQTMAILVALPFSIVMVLGCGPPPRR